jgi:hypothetical protein
MTTLTKDATIAEVYGPAMEIADQPTADSYFTLLVERTMSLAEVTKEEAESRMRENLAYYAGYFDNETRERVERLFKCAHPIFGAIAEKGPITPGEAFKLGQELGLAHKQRGEPQKE